LQTLEQGFSGADIMQMLNGVTKVVGSLADSIKAIGNKVQTQGHAMETLGVSINRLEKSTADAVAAPERRRFKGFVDSDGDYSDYEELKNICGTTLKDGAPLLQDAQQRLAETGNTITELQHGTLKMLAIRRRVKSRYFAHIGGAVISNDVLPDGDADWEMLMEETMAHLKVDAPAAYDYLTSDISPPTKRQPKTKGKGKGKGKTKRKAKRAGSGSHSVGNSSSSGSSSSSDQEANGTKTAAVASTAGRRKAANGSKGAEDDSTVRAYQPMTQSIAHVLEAIKKRVVPMWFETVGSHRKTMAKATAKNWLENMNEMPEDEDEVTEEQRNAPVRPRFICADAGHDGLLAAVKEMFTHLGVADRIRLPTGVGNKENVHTTTGHVSLVAMFVRAELEQIAAGIRRKRRGKDNGWYDRWRWELLTVHPLMPTTTAPWRGFVVNDVNAPTRCDFEHPPVPINSVRTRTVRERPTPTDSVPGAQVARGTVTGTVASSGGVGVGGAGATGAAGDASGATEGAAGDPMLSPAHAFGLTQASDSIGAPGVAEAVGATASV